VTDAADTTVTAVTDMMNNVMPTAPVNSIKQPANTTQRPEAPQFRPQYMPYMDGRWPAPPGYYPPQNYQPRPPWGYQPPPQQR